MIKVLLIGDSISLDYGPTVRSLVRSDIAIFSKPDTEEAYKNLDLPIGGNGGDSLHVLDYLKKLYAKGELDCQYFFFNCGLHDIKRERPNEDLQISEADYRSNLCKIMDLMHKVGAKVVFITTTEADGTRYRDTMPFTRRAEDVLTFNQIALDVMKNYHADVIDLFTFTDNLGRKGNDLFRDHTHFLPDVIQLQAAFIANAINQLVTD